MFYRMNTLSMYNPFGAPVFYQEAVTSTMDEARSFTGANHGTVIAAGKQSSARGRSGRLWQERRGESLSFTVMLQYGTVEAIPRCLTLRAGLAVALAIEKFTADFTAGLMADFSANFTAFACELQKPPLTGKVLVKWPNDVMLLDKDGMGRKAAGILTEAEGGNVFIGMGINIAQMSFPPELAQKARSIAQALSETAWQKNASNKARRDNDAIAALLAGRRFVLLEMILSRLYSELETPAGASDWRNRLEEKLYMKCKRICFIPGLPEELAGGSSPAVEGILQGIGESGEIRITLDAGETVSFAAGELKLRFAY